VLDIRQGDALELLRGMDAGSVRCCVTSPPYWGLRDYGHEGQLGLERTPEEYVSRLVEVFREVRRVLAGDGTLWLNLGDSYATGAGKVGERPGGGAQGDAWAERGAMTSPNRMPLPGLKPKDLVGIPWRVAFALQADGWVLRSEIVWAKPNPMPESVTDRPTKSHEQLFLLSKAKRIGPEPSRYDDIPEGEARWLAALFDGEGSLVCRREADNGDEYGCHAAQVSIGSTSRALLERLAAVVGEGSVLERDGLNAPMHYWQTSGKRALGLLRRIYPFLVVKQQQARCLIALEERKEIRGGHRRIERAEIEARDLIWNAVKDLNHFGQPDLSAVPEPKLGAWVGGQRYYYDAAAIAEPSTERAAGNVNPQKGAKAYAAGAEEHRTKVGLNAYAEKTRVNGADPTRNRRTVWTVPTQPFPGAHFAVMPEALVEPCILAGSAPGDLVLDPFAGSGTVGVVALRHGRRFVGCELNGEYVGMARRRVAGPLFAEPLG
jgi:DNA modification methylase